MNKVPGVLLFNEVISPDARLPFVSAEEDAVELEDNSITKEPMEFAELFSTQFIALIRAQLHVSGFRAQDPSLSGGTVTPPR